MDKFSIYIGTKKQYEVYTDLEDLKFSIILIELSNLHNYTIIYYGWICLQLYYIYLQRFKLFLGELRFFAILVLKLYCKKIK